MTKRISIPYFPRALKAITPLLFGLAIYLVFIGHPIWGILLALTGAIILTTSYVTEIDQTEKKFRDYTSILGIPLNKEIQQYHSLDRIVVTKGNYAQTVNTRVQSRTMKWSDYTGTLVYDQGKTLDLITRNEKKALVIELKEFADLLKVGVEDRTSAAPYWIDLDKI